MLKTLNSEYLGVINKMTSKSELLRKYLKLLKCQNAADSGHYLDQQIVEWLIFLAVFGKI